MSKTLKNHLENLEKYINTEINKGSLPPSIFRSKFKTGFDKSSDLFNDPTYIPFYYYLGIFLSGIRDVVEFGFDLGIPSGSFMEGSKTVNNFLAFRKKNSDFLLKRLGIANIHSILKKKFSLWVGDETDPEFVKQVFTNKWDLVIIDDSNQSEGTYQSYLELMWNQMKIGGLIIIDHISIENVKKAYNFFCKAQNRDPFIINTNRKTGILQK